VGELEVLGRVAVREDTDRALDAWRGPFGELQDFSFADGMLEVKTCQPDTGGRVQIAEPGQIVVDEQRPMSLAVVRLSVGAPMGRSLPEIVSSMMVRMTEMQRQRFRELLAAYGYIESHAADYPDRMLTQAPECFIVKAGFPHLEPAYIPGGVVAVRYSIELAALAPYRRRNPHLENP
jgi:hypothetical protein